MNKKEATDSWNWPDELDALIAAPEHHKLMFENEFVRVLDTIIPSGEKTEIHTHKNPASYFVVCWSDCIRYDEMGNIIFDSRNLDAEQTPVPESVFWSEPLIPHSLENIGSETLRVISFEIKK